MRAALTRPTPGPPSGPRPGCGWPPATPGAAVQLFAPLAGVDHLSPATPDAARLYAHALSAAGLHVEVPGFLAEVERAAQAFDNPVALAGALRGVVEARPDAAECGRVAAECQRFLGRWPQADAFDRLRAEALARVAESTAPEWDAAKVAAALQAAERWRARRPQDRAAAVTLVTLRLHGTRNAVSQAGQAYRDAAPLRDAEADPLLTADELDALGSAYLAVGKFDDARRVLERLTRSAAAPPGALVRLARAHLAQRNLPEARAALAAAQARPRNPQDQADYVAAVRQLQQENP